MPELIIQGKYYCRMHGIWYTTIGAKLVKAMPEIGQMLDNAWIEQG